MQWILGSGSMISCNRLETFFGSCELQTRLNWNGIFHIIPNRKLDCSSIFIRLIIFFVSYRNIIWVLNLFRIKERMQRKDPLKQKHKSQKINWWIFSFFVCLRCFSVSRVIKRKIIDIERRLDHIKYEQYKRNKNISLTRSRRRWTKYLFIFIFHSHLQ